VGKSEQRELASRMAVLLAHLLKWQYQPERRGASWEKTIKAQRKEIAYALDESPSLAPKLQEARWLDMVWARAVAQAVGETGLDCFPEECPWAIADEVLAQAGFLRLRGSHAHRNAGPPRVSLNPDGGAGRSPALGTLRTETRPTPPAGGRGGCFSARPSGP
jgi:hypothetical protein